jgi:hypothetical protein
MATRIGSASWREGQRLAIHGANKRSGVEPTAAQLEAQLIMWQNENVAPVFAAMDELGGPVIVEFTLDEAATDSLSLERRAAALRVANHHVPPSDRTRSERLAAVATELTRRIAEEKEKHRGTGNAAEVVAGLAKDFRRCYNVALTKHPDLEVKGKLTLKVDASGSVIDVRSADFPPGEFAACLDSVGRSAHFSPPREGGTTVVVPLTFKVKD